jgi:hypothetical protein
MRILYEEDIENYDFLEIILNQKDSEDLSNEGIVKEFLGGLCGKRNLNVYLRVDPNEEENMPLVKGKAAKSKKGFSENVKAEMNAGKKQSQAVAIAYSEARGGKKKPGKKAKKG